MKTVFFFLSLLFLWTALSFAGSFQVMPPKVTMDFKKGAKASLTVTNKGEEKVAVQVDVVEWTQDPNGNEVYKPTKDIAFFPKIFSLEPNKDAIVRLGWPGKQPEGEKTYRVFLRELPVSKPGQTAVRTAIQITLPVFIPGMKETKTPAEIEKTELVNGTLIVKVKNSGNTHIMASKIKAVGLDESGEEAFRKEITGWYVLSGISRVFPVEIPSEGCLKAKIIKVTVEDENSKTEASLKTDAVMCAPKKIVAR